MVGPADGEKKLGVAIFWVSNAREYEKITIFDQYLSLLLSSLPCEAGSN